MTLCATNTATPKSAIALLSKLAALFKAQTKTVEFRVMTVVLTALMLWAAAIVIFGYPALILVALTLVPIIFVCLMLITVGK